MAHSLTPDAVALHVTRGADGTTTVAVVPPIDVANERATIEARFTGVRKQHESALVEVSEALARAQSESEQQLKDVAAALEEAKQAATTLPLRHDSPIDLVIAIVGYEAIRLYAASQGDVTLRPWAVADSMPRAAALYVAKGIVAGEVKTPEESHGMWRTTLINSGWRYGPQFDVVNKADPMLAAWADLADAQRTRSTLFVTIALAMLNR